MSAQILIKMRSMGVMGFDEVKYGEFTITEDHFLRELEEALQNLALCYPLIKSNNPDEYALGIKYKTESFEKLQESMSVYYRGNEKASERLFIEEYLTARKEHFKNLQSSLPYGLKKFEASDNIKATQKAIEYWTKEKNATGSSEKTQKK